MQQFLSQIPSDQDNPSNDVPIHGDAAAPDQGGAHRHPCPEVSRAVRLPQDPEALDAQ
jgi:hypothetical protein